MKKTEFFLFTFLLIIVYCLGYKINEMSKVIDIQQATIHIMVDNEKELFERLNSQTFVVVASEELKFRN